MQHRPKSPVDQLVRGIQLTLKVARQKQYAEHDAPHHVAEYKLQESEIAAERNAGHADDGERAGLRRDDREGNGPPWHAAAGKKITGERLFLLAKTQAEERDADKVDGNQGEIKGVKP